MKKIIVFWFLAQTLSGAWATTLNKVDLSAYPKALCNNGDPAAFYFVAGTSAQNWVFMLDGGGACYNAAECDRRPGQ